MCNTLKGEFEANFMHILSGYGSCSIHWPPCPQHEIWTTQSCAWEGAVGHILALWRGACRSRQVLEMNLGKKKKWVLINSLKNFSPARALPSRPWLRSSRSEAHDAEPFLIWYLYCIYFSVQNSDLSKLWSSTTAKVAAAEQRSGTSAFADLDKSEAAASKSVFYYLIKVSPKCILGACSCQIAWLSIEQVI